MGGGRRKEEEGEEEEEEAKEEESEEKNQGERATKNQKKLDGGRASSGDALVGACCSSVVGRRLSLSLSLALSLLALSRAPTQGHCHHLPLHGKRIDDRRLPKKLQSISSPALARLLSSRRRLHAP